MLHQPVIARLEAATRVAKTISFDGANREEGSSEKTLSIRYRIGFSIP
jgi:hypothetical protein